jgi:hypothetical protein
MIYEILENNQVVNTIVADLTFMQSAYPQGNYRELPEPEAPPAPPEPRHITVGSFFDRFGTHKYPILASTNPLVQALIKDVSVRKFVNLDDPQLPQGLGMIESAGFDIDPEAIISAEIQPQERA